MGQYFKWSDRLKDLMTEFVMTRNAMPHAEGDALPALGNLEDSLDADTVFEFPESQKAGLKRSRGGRRSQLDSPPSTWNSTF